MDNMPVAEQHELSDIETELDDMLKHIQQMEEEASVLHQLIDFYRDERMKMMNVLKKIQMLDENGELNISLQTKTMLEEVAKLQEKLGAKKMNSVSVGLTHAEKLRKQSNYIGKLKMCIKVYTNLNEKLSEEVKTIKFDLEQSKDKVNSLAVSADELKNLEVKVKRYENELTRFEKRYPWLKDPMLNLPKIAKEMEILSNLREEKAKLQEQLDVYQGLKPDMKEASQQLAQMKIDSEKILKNLVANDN